MLKPGLFLDRDGVLNLNTHYPHNLVDLYLDPTVGQTFSYLLDQGIQVAVVSNQLGVEKGLFTLDHLYSFQAEMRNKIYELSGYDLTGRFFNCTASLSYLRKPNPGLLFQAATQLHLSIAESTMIGDKDTDIEAGIAAGCKQSYKKTDKETLWQVIQKLKI